MTDILEFIRIHGGEDPARLLLGKNKWPDIDMDLVVNTVEGRKRMASKVPQWAGRDDLLYPTRLCTEQCSSGDTAAYKASVLGRLGGRRIADLTGGLGVDSWFFSKVADRVLYNEMNPVLAGAVSENFKALGAGNIKISNRALEPDTAGEILGDFAPDIIFMDPARRASDGRKVFRIEDCTPDVMSLKEELLEVSRYLVVKLSPMADISLAVEALGHVSEIHCVGAGGECKELLIVMDREASGEPVIVVADSEGEVMRFLPSEEREAEVRLIDGIPDHGFLFEPSKAAAKAGCFKLLCSRYGLRKAGRNTHLYIVPSVESPFCPADLSRLGKLFEINEVVPLNNRSIKALGSAYPDADLSARNLPMDTAALAKKMGPGAKKTAGRSFENSRPPHIFAFRADFSSGADSSNYMLVCKPLYQHQ